MPRNTQDVQSLPVVSTGDGYRICIYQSKLSKPFLVFLDEMTFRKRIRFFIEALAGFTVYYLLCDGECAGYAAVSGGGTKRYGFCTKADIFVGPIFINEAFRGRKLSILLLKEVLALQVGNYEYAYGYAHKDNAPSLAACKAAGMTTCGNAKITPFTRRLVSCSDGDYVLVRKFHG